MKWFSYSSAVVARRIPEELTIHNFFFGSFVIIFFRVVSIQDTEPLLFDSGKRIFCSGGVCANFPAGRVRKRLGKLGRGDRLQKKQKSVDHRLEKIYCNCALSRPQKKCNIFWLVSVWQKTPANFGMQFWLFVFTERWSWVELTWIELSWVELRWVELSWACRPAGGPFRAQAKGNDIYAKYVRHGIARLVPARGNKKRSRL